ncbi:MAG: amino acid permease [Alphaproteobacteria bacterium]
MLGRRKPVETLLEHKPEHRLKPTLSWPHLVAMGVGAIVGTGIYTLIGKGAELAGPGVMLSFVIAGAVCAFAALCYAELATALPASGSAYTYSYVTMGETIAWVIGWSLVLEYTVSCAAVATGWSGYVGEFLKSVGLGLPETLLHGPLHAGGGFNLPAVLISFVVTGLLLVGARESATVNLGLVAIKVAALALFIGLTIFAIRPANFAPFMPYGIGDPFGFLHAAPGEVVKGVMPAAAIIFFAFYGFDAVAASAEETKNPGRDLTIGILGSMVLCTVLYLLVAACAIGSMVWSDFTPDKTSAPLAFILRTLNHPLAASLISGAAIVALPTVIMVMMYGQTRVFFVMARDGLLPQTLTAVHPRRGVPTRVTLVIGLLVAVVSGTFELGDLASVANAGTLAAFISVAAGVLILRQTHPALERKFRTPLVVVVAPLAIIGCLYLFISLQTTTIIAFLGWNIFGFAVYAVYGRRRSLLARTQAD